MNCFSKLSRVNKVDYEVALKQRDEYLALLKSKNDELNYAKEKLFDELDANRNEMLILNNIKEISNPRMEQLNNEVSRLKSIVSEEEKKRSNESIVSHLFNQEQNYPHLHQNGIFLSRSVNEDQNYKLYRDINDQICADFQNPSMISNPLSSVLPYQNANQFENSMSINSSKIKIWGSKPLK